MALGGAREDLVDSLSAWVVKASKSEAMRKFYSPDTVAPTVVFFRKRYVIYCLMLSLARGIKVGAQILLSLPLFSIYLL